jgi:predicted aspartyl protease
MGMVYTEITLKNSADVMRARDGYRKKEDIRQITVKALVDTGTWNLVISEDIRQKLGLEVTGAYRGRLANGLKAVSGVAGPVEIWWKDRFANCDALVLPGAKNVLLGAIPLEAMDLIVNPKCGEVVGAHGDEMEFFI